MDEDTFLRPDLTAAVAAILEAADYTLQFQPDMEGFEVDLVASRGQTSGQVRVAVEIKHYSKLVGLRTVRAFAGVLQVLLEARRVHEGWLVTSSGFTQRAREEAERSSIKLFTVDELRQSFQVSVERVRSRADALRTRDRSSSKKRVFVIMPFDDAMNDVYVLGIGWVARKLGIVAQRADEIEHNGDILGEIQRAIREYDGVVADTSAHNANVYYEVGYAHAHNRPTVLICRHGSDLPFDVRGFNHVMYRNIQHLRELLEPRLKKTLKL